MTNHEDSSLTLSAKQAYAVMCEFTWRYLGSTAGDDLVQLIGDTEMIEDGTSFDPSAWDLWIACVEYVKAGGRPRAGDA